MQGLTVSDESLHGTSMEGLTMSEALIMTPHEGTHLASPFHFARGLHTRTNHL